MKAHVAVDSRHKLIHTVLVSAANVAAETPPRTLMGRSCAAIGEFDTCNRGSSGIP